MVTDGLEQSHPCAQPSGPLERRVLAVRAGIVAAGTLLSRVLGLAREMVIAALFRRAETDAFYVAFTIPNALRLLLAEGAAASAVVPVLTETRERDGEDAARRLFQAVRGLWLALLTIVTALGILFAPQLCELFAAGFHGQPGQFERTVMVTRWVFVFIALMGSAALGMAALNAHRRFAVPAFSPALLNVGMILLACVAPMHLTAYGYDPTLALAFGALAGGSLHVVAQWPALKAIGYWGRPRLQLSHPGVREIVRRIVPMSLGMGVYFANLAISRRLLSDLGEGAQSYFTWAFRLCALPQGLFIMALSSAALPSLASLATAGQRQEVAKTYAYGMRLALFVALPAATLLVILAHPIVVALFQRGEFGSDAALETAAALVAQALGIAAVAAARQLVPVYFALGDTRTPVVGSTVNLVSFVALALWLRTWVGHAGVGLALSGANAVQMVLLWALVRRQLPSLRLGEIGRAALRTAVACGVAGVAGWLVAEWIGMPPDAAQLRRLVPALLGGAAFGVVFVIAARLGRSAELEALGQALRRRLAPPNEG